MTDEATTAATDQRVVRVFVSSTFRDMNAERDELVKRTFPQLRKLCQERGVVWSEVDLRWGITDEQKAEGRVLPICLAEIQRCRPYFIGLLGERYGWVPDEIPGELIELEPWLTKHLHHSVTELEILHGVLRNVEMAEHAFFYFRDPSFIDSLPDEQRLDYHEIPGPDEIARYGYAEAERRANSRRQKLAALKDRIRGSGVVVRENYANPQALGELVLKDLSELIDRLYPEDADVDPYESEVALHEALARAQTQVFVSRTKELERLDEFADGDGQPLAVLGESGVGKSSLLARWALQYRESHPGVPMLMHLIGASGPSTSFMTILLKIGMELERHFGAGKELLDSFNQIRLGDFHKVVAKCMLKAAEKGRMVIILDGLNLLDDQFEALELMWLPTEIPPNIRLIVSTLPGRALDEINHRRWSTLEVKPLHRNNRKELITKYLAQYTKELSAERGDRIASARGAGNPLYLRVLLEELRIYGDHFTLDERIDHYLSAGTIVDLYEKTLERYELDFEQERPGLVRDVMSLIWAARMGISETDLLKLLGGNEEPLPQRIWSPLHLAAESLLVSHGGLISFYHDYLRKAVQRRYLSTDRVRRAFRLRMADYLELHARNLGELMWQLAEARFWRRLASLLADPPITDDQWKLFFADVKSYWSQIEASSSVRMVDVYRPVVDNPAEHLDHVRAVAALLMNAGYVQEAELLRTNLLAYHRRTGEAADLAALFETLAMEPTSSVPVYIPTPHPGANAERAAQLNAQYQRDVAQWRTLPWWKRLRTKKPERPGGI